MKVKWLIQDVGLIASQMYRKFDALDAMGEPISGIGVMAEHPYITGLEDAVSDDLDTKYVLLVGVKVLNLLKAANSIADVMENPTDFHLEHSDYILNALIEGIFYDFETFDQAYYGQLGLPLLNASAEYIAVKDHLDTAFEVDKFVKPSRDLKAFDAGILKAGETVESFILSKSRQRFYLEELLVVSDVLEMKDEYRFFVVDKQVVAGSAYRLNGVVGESLEIDAAVQQAAKDFAMLYQPAEIFTMDLARLKNDSIKIIEYNCFNCSGVYLCDLVNTYTELKAHVLNDDLPLQKKHKKKHQSIEHGLI